MPASRKSSSDVVDPVAMLGVLAKVREGDFAARMPVGWTGLAGKVADDLNEVIIANQTLAGELARVSRVVGKQGELFQRVTLGGATHPWAGSVESVNDLIEDLVRPTSEMQRVIGAVADGDLSKKVTAEVHGDMLDLKNTINAMVDQLNGFISEVTRVTREVGTEGKLGQAAAITMEVGGVWKELTDNVNLMASNLTSQIRNIAEVSTGVAQGDLSKKITIDAMGEFLELKNTINGKVEKLRAFSGEVTRVAREVGVEGKLGGQAQTEEVGGVWKELTDNVNQLAANLTNQVRAISDVATAVTEGDLTRQVTVEASGEVAVLKDTVNEMIRNLRETTRLNVEQDWLKTNLARFAGMLQGQRDLATVSDMILSELAPLVSAHHAVFYSMTTGTGDAEPVLELTAGYGYEERKSLSRSFRIGEGLVGQCAKEKKRILLTDVPADYVRINSGLGAARPLNIIVLPVLFEGTVRAVLELASFSAFSATHQDFLDQLPESIGLVLNTIEADTITGNLLRQSQSQAEELLAQNLEAERNNRLIQESRSEAEAKAGELALSSRYKTEFIANMSHELRTPLNSLLILAEQLRDNPEQNLTDTQVEYASVIHDSGRDLLKQLNAVLDLAKVESGTVTLEPAPVPLGALQVSLEVEFAPLAARKGLEYSFEVLPGTPSEIVTDPQRLRQILKNLLTNAFKFTSHGEVRVQVAVAESGWSPHNMSPGPAGVLGISIRDTGVGIDAEQQQRIFEPFTQADGATARVYGGTGLGLSISRELMVLLGGEITLQSEPGAGSTFTIYLPIGATASVPAAPEPVPPSRLAADVLLDDRPFAGSRVLVVDDDFRNIFALTALLERGHAEVAVAESGAEALAVLDREAIDLVLMDIMMPGMDGYETIRAIRAREQFAELPILAVTARVVPDERRRCLEAGANEYVPKPVDTGELIAAIGPWLPVPETVAS